MSEKTNPIGGACPECGCDGTHHVTQPAPAVPLKEHQRVQAEAAAMRRALEKCRKVGLGNSCMSGKFLDDALSTTTAGAGWLSPEEAEKLRAEVEQFKRAATAHELEAAKHIRERDESRAEAEKLRAEAGAEAGAMRRELGSLRACFEDDLEDCKSPGTRRTLQIQIAGIDRALSLGAGRDILARLERAEKERDEALRERDAANREASEANDDEADARNAYADLAFRHHAEVETLWAALSALRETATDQQEALRQIAETPWAGRDGYGLALAVAHGALGDPPNEITDALKAPWMRRAEHAAEVRRAVEEERERLVDLLRPEHPDAIRTIRARGGKG